MANAGGCRLEDLFILAVLGNNLSLAQKLLHRGAINASSSPIAMMLAASMIPRQVKIAHTLRQAEKYCLGKPFGLAFLAAAQDKLNRHAEAAAARDAFCAGIRVVVNRWIDKIRTAARTGRQVVVGPWCGEVGFEALYWIPFCRHLMPDEDVREWVTIVSRGGMGHYYWNGGRQFDYFALPDISLDAMLRERVELFGTQKQFGLTTSEKKLLHSCNVDTKRALVIHPAIMFQLIAPFYNPLTARLFSRATLLGFLTPFFLKGESDTDKAPYAYIDLYSRPSFKPGAGKQQDIIARIEQWRAIHGIKSFRSIRLSQAVDDHSAIELDKALGIETESCEPLGNLKRKVDLMLGARCAILTYGGMVYLANAARLPTMTLRTTDNGIQQEHEELATMMFPFAPKLHLTI